MSKSIVIDNKLKKIISELKPNSMTYFIDKDYYDVSSLNKIRIDNLTTSSSFGKKQKNKLSILKSINKDIIYLT